MAFVVAGSVPWHEGEEEMHKLMRVPFEENPTAPSLTPGATSLLRRAPLFAIGTLDKLGRPWTTVWGGEPGFAGPVATSTIGVGPVVDRLYDPVVEAFLDEKEDEQVVNHGDDGKLMAGLAIDLQTRKRVKLEGRVLATRLDEGAPSSESVGQAQVIVKINGSLGNCPKYLNKKKITPALLESKLISDSPQLAQGAIDLLNNVDTLFLSTSHQDSSMDTNIRGGPRGFVRVLSNDSDGAVLVYPEYSGNRLFQSLGNMQTTPRAGYTFPDFETGNVLYATGDTQILVGKDAAQVLPKSNLAVKFTVTAARYIEKGLPFRGEPGDYSPYNPAVRYLASERITPGSQNFENRPVAATLIKKEVITPSINRFRFKISDIRAFDKWIPGQYATLSFEDELDMGYSHMKDDDPTSINDDYIRTFTVSSFPDRKLPDDEFEIIARRNGNATSHLFRSSDRSGLELGLKGFDGQFRFEEAEQDHLFPFVAGGIGITPVIAQLPGIDISRLRLFWSIALRDIALVAEVFEEFPELPKSTTLFITGTEQAGEALSESERKKFEIVTTSGAQINRRRVQASDLDIPGLDEWYLCASAGLKARVLNWLTGKRVIYEDFSY